MRAIRVLVGLAAVASLLWGGYWYAGSRALQAGVAEVLRQNGPLSAAGHSVAGFPNRFDLTLDQPRLRADGIAWSAPFVQLFALTYRPHHVVMVMANEQELSLNGLTAAIRSADLRASAVMRPTERLALDRAALVGQGLLVTADLPGYGPHSATLEDLRLAIRPDAARSAPGAYQVGLEMLDLSLAPDLMARLDPAEALPRRFESLRLDLDLALSQVLDLDALRGQPPELDWLTVTRARVAGDGMVLDLALDITSPPGTPLAGSATLTITGWEELLARLRRAGVMSPDQLDWIGRAAPGLVSPDAPGAIAIPFTIANGTVSLLSIPLIELPTAP